MTIIFGRDVLELSDPSQPCCKCEDCGKNELFVAITARWLFVMFVPVFLLKNYVNIYCLNCKSEFNEKNLTGDAAEYYKQQVKKARSLGGWAIQSAFILSLVIFICLVISIK